MGRLAELKALVADLGVLVWMVREAASSPKAAQPRDDDPAVGATSYGEVWDHPGDTDRRLGARRLARREEP